MNPEDWDVSRIEQIEEKYLKEKKKLFPRELLEKISRARKDAKPSIELPDYVDGDESPYRLALDLGYNPEEDNKKRIAYVPIQNLLNPWWHHRQGGEEVDCVNPIHNFKSRWTDLKLGESLSFRDLRRDWDVSYKMWNKSLTKVAVLEAFNNIPNEKLKQVTKVIAFDNGSFAYEHASDPIRVSYWRTLNKNTARHAVIQDIRTFIEQKFKHPVAAYVQDEEYTKDEDLPLLESIGLKRLHDPDGYLEVDENTIVFAIMTENAFLQVIADTSTPAMIIHQGIFKEEWEDYKTTRTYPNGHMRPNAGFSSDPTSPRVEELINGYEERNLADPDERFDGAARLFIRKAFPKLSDPQTSHQSD